MRKRLTIDQVDAAIARWQSKATRAANMLSRLHKQRKRLAKPKLATVLKPELERIAESLPAPVQVETDHLSDREFDRWIVAGKPTKDGKAVKVPQPKPPAADTLDVREQPWNKPNAADEAAKAEIVAAKADRAKKKKAGQDAARKARLSGATRRMPLQGKAALEHIAKGA